MNYRNKLILSLAAVTVLCLSAHGDMIQNGGFENSTTGWTTYRIDLVHSSYWLPSEGTYSIDLNSYYPGRIEQIIDTVIGTTYKLTFDMSGNYHTNPKEKKMNVNAIGATTQTKFFSFDSTNSTKSDMGWITESWTFVADSTATKLQFVSITGNSGGAALDNISMEAVGCVNPVPVPWLQGDRPGSGVIL